MGVLGLTAILKTRLILSVVFISFQNDHPVQEQIDILMLHEKENRQMISSSSVVVIYPSLQFVNVGCMFKQLERFPPHEEHERPDRMGANR